MRKPKADLSDLNDVNKIRKFQETGRFLLLVHVCFYFTSSAFKDISYNKETLLYISWMLIFAVVEFKSIQTLYLIYIHKSKHSTFELIIFIIPFLILTPLFLLIYSFPYVKLKSESKQLENTVEFSSTHKIKRNRKFKNNLWNLLKKYLAYDLFKSRLSLFNSGYRRLIIAITILFSFLLTYILAFIFTSINNSEYSRRYSRRKDHIDEDYLFGSFLLSLVIDYIILLIILWIKDGFNESKKKQN